MQVTIDVPDMTDHDLGSAWLAVDDIHLGVTISYLETINGESVPRTYRVTNISQHSDHSRAVEDVFAPVMTTYL